MAHLSEHSLDIIIQEKKLTVHFQPIIENNARNIFGYEALIRGPLNSHFHSPITLFEAATKHGR